jgi:hypothetical protein
MKYQVKQLALGEILDQAIAIIRDNLGLLFGIVAITIPFQAIVGLLQYTFLKNANLIGIILTLFASIVVGMPLGLLVNAACYHAIASVYLSRPTTIRRSFQHAFSRFLPSLGALLLTILAVMGGLLLFVIPGILFMFWFALAVPVTVLESHSAGSAMDRSRQLMKGNMLALLALGLVEMAMGMGIAVIAQFVPQAHLQIIAASFIQALTTILGLSAIVVFYYSCRCKAENFDLHVLAQAISAADLPSGESVPTELAE